MWANYILALCVFAIGRGTCNSELPRKPAQIFYSAEDYQELKSASEQRCLVPRSMTSGNCSLVDRSCLLYYFHMHKTGGSTVCRAANGNRFKTTGLQLNCNVPSQVVAKIQYLVARNISFVAQEGGRFKPIRRKAVTPLYFATIRDPLDRVLSHIHHGFCIRGSNEILEFTQMGCTFNADEHSFADVILSPCFEKMYYVNNFYVQQFGDCSYDSCSEEHLKGAVDALNILSAIIITEDFDRLVPNEVNFRFVY